ncbi:hypothetical protein CRM22_005563 [Opisthorchis felineus]|uniref:CWH43-like N-terminal domain-containing protein n=1 Tax=Opisthorchis felineus TaxID=147828 RepID=A0A4S2LQI6_OPIFE|nr:hypothetical protein CRM22_005563 [Opisthorchis felineus]
MTDSYPAAIIPMFSLTVAISAIILSWIISSLLDHTDQLWPFVSFLQLFVPEGQVSTWQSLLCITFGTLSLWLWCSMAQHELKEKSAPQTAYLLVAIIRILVVATGYFQLLLFSVNSADNNQTHYNSTVRMFLSVKLILVTQIILSVRFLQLTRLHTAARIILLTQSSCGMMIFYYYNLVGNKSYNGEYPYRRAPGRAYYPYMYCAIGEWMMVSAFLVFTLLQALELRHFEIRLPEVVPINLSEQTITLTFERP